MTKETQTAKRKAKYYDLHGNTLNKIASIMYFAGRDGKQYQAALDEVMVHANRAAYFLAAKRKAP